MDIFIPLYLFSGCLIAIAIDRKFEQLTPLTAFLYITIGPVLFVISWFIQLFKKMEEKK